MITNTMITTSLDAPGRPSRKVRQSQFLVAAAKIVNALTGHMD
jgi:hypothetical protein